VRVYQPGLDGEKWGGSCQKWSLTPPVFLYASNFRHNVLTSLNLHLEHTSVTCNYRNLDLEVNFVHSAHNMIEACAW
jgi:hypothetical protein